MGNKYICRASRKVFVLRMPILLLLVNTFIGSISSQVLILKWTFDHFASFCSGFHF